MQLDKRPATNPVTREDGSSTVNTSRRCGLTVVAPAARIGLDAVTTDGYSYLDLSQSAPFVLSAAYPHAWPLDRQLGDRWHH